MITFSGNAKTKNIAISTSKKVGNNFALIKKNSWLLWLSQCLNIAVISLELSHWMLAVIGLSLALQALLLNKAKNGNNIKASRVSPIVLGIFALLGCIAIAITAKQVGLLISMLHLLCFSYALKAFELKARSDFYQLLLLGIFVLASSLIFRQDLVFSIITITFLLINLAVLLQFFSYEKAFKTDLKVIAILMGQSAILAVVLFLVFPRISPFWQMPSNKSAETGLSDSVKPGDIANLSRSTKLAFRADFGQQEVPNYSQLYWRAMVLENFDGKEWTRSKSLATKELKEKFKQSFKLNLEQTDILPLNYQVIAEPSFQKYLFTLAPAVSLRENRGIKTKVDYTFMSKKIISQAKSYRLRSYLSAPLGLELSDISRKMNLAYPEGSNPRLEKMALQLQKDYPEAQTRAQAILSLIHKNNYSYTLQPPLLSNNSLDEFFFDTQAGFCVHYATSFTFLMRASGIPARLVTGYLGGEYNGTNTNDSDNKGDIASKGHLSIYQYDAHAWSEIWIKNKGWIRIDPTGAVDPERVNSGLSNELLQEQSVLNKDLFSLYQFKNIQWLNSLRLQFDALDYQWTRWVIGFTSEQQYNLFQNWFGKMASWKLALIIGSSLVISMAMLMLFLYLFNRSKRIVQPLTKWQALYHKALEQLAKQGIQKPVSMTVNDFSKQVRDRIPELAIVFTQLSGSYNALCYRTLTTDEQTKLTLMMDKQYRSFVHTLKNN